MTLFGVDQRGSTGTAAVSRSSGSNRELWLVLATLSLLYVMAITVVNRRYVWFDELFTFDISRSASLQQLWSRILRFDCNPPTAYLLSRISMSTLGHSSLGLRLPSILEFYLGSVAILLYVRRKADAAFAALAVLMVWAAGPTFYYAVEARPYALLFSSFAWLLFFWDNAIQPGRRRGAIIGVAASSLVLILAHVFAPVTLFAFVVAEVVRFRRRKILDPALWAALLLPTMAMVCYVPLIRLYSGVIFADDISRASLRRILAYFDVTLRPSTMFFVLIAALFAPVAKKIGSATIAFLPEEFALFGFLLLSPIFINLLLMIRHGLFYDRYSITSQVATLMVLALIVAHRTHLNRWSAYAASLVLILAILKTQVWNVLRHPVPPNAAFLVNIDPELPIVVGAGTAFMEMNHHEEAPLLSRLYFLKDQEASMRYAHTNYFQDFEAPDLLKKAGFPITGNVESDSTFIANHSNFLLLGDTNNPTEWIFPMLRQQGARLSKIGEYSGSMPYTDSTLFSVVMPAP